MTYHPALILKKAEGGYGVEFPDFPGCVARAGTLEGALGRAEHALREQVDEMTRAGKKPPPPSSLESVLAKSKDQGAAAMLVRLAPPKGRAVRVNMTMDEHLLAEIDGAAKAAGTTRSGFLAAAARQALSDKALSAKNEMPGQPLLAAGTEAAAEDPPGKDMEQALDKFRRRIAQDERERLFHRLEKGLRKP